MHKKRFFAIMIIVFSFSRLVYSQEIINIDKLFLWEIKSKTAHVYLLGSIHVSKTDLYPLNKNIENAFNNSDNLAVESDVLNIDQSEVFKLTMKHGFFTDGDNLKNHLTDSVYNKLFFALKKYNLDINNFLYMKPWLAAITIELMYYEKNGYSPVNGIDYYFLKKAGAKNIISLETMEDQLSLFDNIPLDLQTLYLESSLKETKNNPKDIDKLFLLWETGNIKELENYLNNYYLKYKHLQPIFKVLLDDRNIKMAEKINQFLNSDKTYFVIIGSAHFVGSNNLLDLLKQKGFEINQINKGY